MFIYISVIAILVIISTYLALTIMVLKLDLKNLQLLYDNIEDRMAYWQNKAKNYKHSLHTLNNAKVLSEKDIKSLVVMIPPVRQPESCKQRVTEEFINYKNKIQGSNP